MGVEGPALSLTGLRMKGARLTCLCWEKKTDVAERWGVEGSSIGVRTPILLGGRGLQCNGKLCAERWGGGGLQCNGQLTSGYFYSKDAFISNTSIIF